MRAPAQRRQRQPRKSVSRSCMGCLCVHGVSNRCGTHGVVASSRGVQSVRPKRAPLERTPTHGIPARVVLRCVESTPTDQPRAGETREFHELKRVSIHPRLYRRLMQMHHFGRSRVRQSIDSPPPQRLSVAGYRFMGVRGRRAPVAPVPCCQSQGPTPCAAFSFV